MGGEISKQRFGNEDYQRFQARLELETDFVRELFRQRRFDNEARRLGYELELCLLNDDGEPAACNDVLLEEAHNPHFTVELAKFNLEINGNAFDVEADVFDRLRRDMQALYGEASEAARRHGCRTGLFGVLPSLSRIHLDKRAYMSELSRYRLLDQRVMQMRGRPVHLDIQGQDHLEVDKHDVMLEALGTSLQIHYQLPLDDTPAAYHAALWSCLAVVGACANSPLVLGARGWQESRIAIFKQAVDSRNPNDNRDPRTARVHLARGYIDSWMEMFEDNLKYSPILPEVLDTGIGELHHFNLHNGTIWRWVRPIVGIDGVGRYHLRLELRVTPAGPTLADSLVNLVFQVGLIEGLRPLADGLTRVPYQTLERDFYRAARYGLAAEVSWCNGETGRLQDLLLRYAIPTAVEGLDRLGISNAGAWLDVMRQRVQSGRTGARWILDAWSASEDARALVNRYLENARNNQPVHQWPDYEV